MFYSMDTKRMKTQGGPRYLLYSMDTKKMKTQGGPRYLLYSMDTKIEQKWELKRVLKMAQDSITR